MVTDRDKQPGVASMRMMAVVAAFALSGCAAEMMQSTPMPAVVDTASFSMKSWGRLLHQWTMDADGRVEHVQNPEPFGDRAKQELLVRRIALTRAQRQSLTVAIDAVKAKLAEPEDCRTRMTDGPYGDLEWVIAGTPAKLPWNANCTEGRDAELSSAVSKVDRIVDDAARATAVVERRPVDPGAL